MRVKSGTCTPLGYGFVSVLIVFCLYSVSIVAQTDVPVKPDQPQQTNPQTKPDTTPSRSLNIDMQLAYGQYNNMLSTISLSQESDNFVYLLNSNYKRSNDFGYKKDIYFNTSYQENKIGFTGTVNMAEDWKTLFEGSVDGGSYGMFENPTYVREEKERYSILMKNTIRSSSVEWYLTANYSGYTHRLVARQTSDNEKSSLNKMSGELGGEYIMSASNRIRWNILSSMYRYGNNDVDSDLSARGQIVDDFKVTQVFGLSLGANSAWDKDSGALYKSDVHSLFNKPIPLPSGTGGITYTGEKTFFASVMYKYDLEPFRPENLFFDQKYVYPEYSLKPSRTHTVEGKADVKISDIFSIKTNSVYKLSRRYYNYYADSNNVLRAHAVEARSISSKVDMSIKIADSGFLFETGYEYSHFIADETVTYRPSNIVNETIRYNGDTWKIEWGNKYISKTYVDPQKNRSLAPAVIGLFGVQMQMVKGFYSYLRVENLYNNRYNLREGYPEPGLAVLGGIRILM
jgi:hypothetical protein